MKARKFNIIKSAGMTKIVRVCSQYPIGVNNDIKVKNGKIYCNREDVTSTRLSNKVMSRKRIRTIKRGC